MKLQEIIVKAGLEALTKIEERDVESVFVCDMLSDVMTHADPGTLWLTGQTHTNIVSAANLVDISAVVITMGKEIPQATIDLANRYNVIILSSELQNFQLMSRLIELGLKP